jgi:tRNA pseudouridine38-40 synthase
METASCARNRNFLMIIEYDGTAFHGWQRQASDRSIQQEIETALAAMTGQKVTLFGSGRTDAGVHALAQTANFHCLTRIMPRDLQNGLNSLLPDDIVIRECSIVPMDFHARYTAKSKLYRYTIFNTPWPPAIGRQYGWWIRAPLDLDAMRAGVGCLIGVHDFKAFEGSGSPRQHTIRNIMRAELNVQHDGRLLFEIEADGFLRYMVRNIIGTLVMIGQGKLAPPQLNTILISRDRRSAGITAPPQGLCLVKVTY